MGQLNGLYHEEFPAGTKVRIKSREFLKEFQRTWQQHHPISPEHVRFGGRVSTVAAVSFYYGGDEMYQLTSVPGLWHEQLLERA